MIKQKVYLTSSIFLLLFLVLTPLVFATSSVFLQKATEAYERFCTKRNVSSAFIMSCYAFDKLTELESKVDTQKRVLDVGQVRGSGLDIDAPTTPLKTPEEVTVNCPVACILWVNYDVDTRNTQIPGVGSWYQHLYHIFINDVDQAVYNQVSATVPNAAYPVGVNGVFPVSAGQHTISIYVKVTGGHLQQFTSHLQVLAIEQ